MPINSVAVVRGLETSGIWMKVFDDQRRASLSVAGGGSRGNVLDILVQRRRDKKAAKKFFRKLLKGLVFVPYVIVTDKLKRYEAAKREILPGVVLQGGCESLSVLSQLSGNEGSQHMHTGDLDLASL